MHNSEEKYSSLPGTDDDKIDTTLEDQTEGKQVESESVPTRSKRLREIEALLGGALSDAETRPGDEAFDSRQTLGGTDKTIKHLPKQNKHPMIQSMPVIFSFSTE